MPENSLNTDNIRDYYARGSVKKDKNNYLLHSGLLLFTFITTTIAGAEWISGTFGPYEVSYLLKGLPYSLSILFVIGSHEFGHYFASRIHKVNATLPYFLPCPPLAGFLNFGTFGAVIRTRSAVHSKKAMFDIGVAGPIAGFVACLIVLIYGFTHLPGKEYILAIHPDYFTPAYGKTGINLRFGDTILFSLLKSIFTNPNGFVPPMSEIYHYPYLCVGWFGLFITSMNMIPVGQLDGGHISYSLFGGKKHYAISVVFIAIMFIIGLIGVLEYEFNLNSGIGWIGWLLWSLVLFFIIKPKHPHIYDEAELDLKRKIIGWISFIILAVSVSPNPFIVTGSV
jgi:membrane-associated protease RseP (regulator of RpoE activity)